MRRKAISTLLIVLLVLQVSPAFAQDRGPLEAELFVARVRGAEVTFLVRTLGADSLQTVILDGSNLAADGTDQPSLTRLGPGLWTFSVLLAPTNVYEARLVLTDGSIIEALIDGESLQTTPGVQTAPPLQDQQDPRNRTQGVRSWAVKQALGLLAKSLRSSGLRWVLNQARQYGGKQVADVVERHAFQIANKLDELARWEDLALQAVQDQIAGLLMGLGVPSYTARQTGFVIKIIVSILM